MSLNFDNSYFRDLPGFYAPANPSAATDPELVVWNGTLAERLGLAELEDGAAELISGFRLPGGADPIAQAYSGHQFGHFSPQLGDGRAGSGSGTGSGNRNGGRCGGGKGKR